MSDGGKGDKRRPGKGYADGFDRVFGKKPAPLPKPVVLNKEAWLREFLEREKRKDED